MRSRFAGIIGNILEHYDNALFGLLAPFLAPLFFDPSDPITGLILTYGMLPLGILTRPLGSLFFGRIGDRYGRSRALFLSLCGMAIATMAIGCLPLYSQVGLWAPFSLALLRMTQSFCAAGETTGGSLFVLERTPESQRSFMSSIYGCSTIVGIMIASALVALFSEEWRLLFLLGGATAIIGLFMRLRITDTMSPVKTSSVWQLIKEHRRALAAIILVAGFSNATYVFSFTLMNGYVPLVTELTKADVMKVNTLLLLFDLALLPCFGYLANRLGKEKVMGLAALVMAILAVPLFYLLDGATLALVIGIRMIIVTLGVAFGASYSAWAMEQVPVHTRFTLLSLGYAIGAQLIGSPASAVSIWLYKETGWVFAPGLYFMLMGLAAFIAIRRVQLRKAVFPREA